MGRTEKSADMKGECCKSKECVSEATISKLLNEFSCTEFLPNLPTSTVECQASPARKEHYSSRYNEVVSSLKHLHLKRPVDRRTKWKEKKGFQEKAKTALDNKYNLAVAATSQKSLLWPGKLSCISNNNKLDSDVIIQPSRLFQPVIGEKPLNTSPFQSSFQTSSLHEKARIVDSINGQNSSLFNNSKKTVKNSKMSFSRLNKASKGKAGTSSIFSSGTLTDPLVYRSCAAGNNFLNLNPDTDNRISNNTNSSAINNVNNSTSSNAKNDLVPFHNLDQPSTSFVCVGSSHSSTSISSGVFPERSCSEEMRMEESNVNELASYFEDLLHIPRKMSVMAEMMYA